MNLRTWEIIFGCLLLALASACFDAGDKVGESQEALDAAQECDGGCGSECEPSNGGVEVCDGLDNDCDGEIDEDFQTGACTVGQGACEASGEYECVDEQTAECNAEPAEPQQEVCGDGVDNDCDGQVDEDDAEDAQTWYADGDGDGFGDDDSLDACAQPDGYVAQGDDCDDEDPAVNPGADEVCDGIDNDCDGQTDPSTAVDATTWYIDCDGDGFAVDETGSRDGCEKPAAPTGCAGSAADWTDRVPEGDDIDCNDDRADAFPGQTDYFDEPMAGGAYDERWDYNCNGEAERRYEVTDAECSDQCSGGWDGIGWVNSFSPACGYSSDYRRCNFNAISKSCEPATFTKTQTCH